MRLAQVRAERGAVRDLAAFGGLNLTDGVHDGELAAAQNLSTRRAPYLATRSTREVVAQYEGADAYYRFDGHTVVCANGRLLFDGEDKGALSRGGKQFAVVGTKLVIVPDKLMLDVQSGEVTKMDAIISADDAEFTENSLLSPFGTVLEESSSKVKEGIAFYSCTEAQFCAAWNGTAWDTATIEAYRESRPSQSCAMILLDVNSDLYGKLKIRYTNGSYEYYVKRVTAVDRMGDVFAVGDTVDVSGTKYGIYDRKALQISKIDGENNLLTFSGTPFSPLVSETYVLTEDTLQNAKILLQSVETIYGINRYLFRMPPLRDPTARIPKGTVICKVGDRRSSDGSIPLALWLPDARDGGSWLASEIWAEPSSGYEPTASEVFMEAYQPGVATVQRSIPDLDFICEHQNRLWGVCNAQDNAVWDEDKRAFSHVKSRVIYASALGEITKFYQFDGVSTDSYQLAVGGEGEFTAICSYGGAILAFKERKLHKLLGGYPAEYYLTSRDFDGVKQGCAKSLAVVGGDLYYKGVRGVYRYGGGTAACVSKKLGEFPCEGVGGTDGRRYYLSADGGLYVLDTQSGIWLREDGAHVTDFAGNEMLVGDTVFRIGTGAADANTPFSAEFAPFAERDGFAELRYVRLSLEVEIGKGAYLAVEVRTDGAWRTVGTAPSGTVGVTVLRLPPMRCGEMRLRLSGRGDVTVRSLRRQYLKRSDRAS